jgi:hypothetical protein
MLTTKPDGMYVEFEIKACHRSGSRRMSMRLELWLLLTSEAADLDELRRLMVDTEHELRRRSHKGPP